MVREAQKTGLQFDETKLRALHCTHEEAVLAEPLEPRRHTMNLVPTIEIDPASPAPVTDHENSPLEHRDEEGKRGISRDSSPSLSDLHHHHRHTKFFRHLHSASTRGKIHDVLQFNNGASRLSVVSWNMMEYLPFRRMDLQEDGSWKAIVWPLPKGEVRDIPDNAIIHCSVIKRMEVDPNYRPGNLIVGGGGRGVRRAPAEMGMGKWKVFHEEGHPVGECYVRREKPESRKTEEVARSFATTPNGPQGMFLSGR